ncbi:MAG: SAVED domain-containing protein [Myxococcales bacterium]|nr:SAVED domain-containing protein [Myxococcales bacterium]
MNGAYIAHIIADKETGPRGHPVLSERLKEDISNLMLLCDVHHRLVDREGLDDHPVERLQAMKVAQEARIELATSIAPEKQSHVLLYGANVGQHASSVEYSQAARAMTPAWFPAEPRAIELGTRNSSAVDHDPAYWIGEAKHLRLQFETQVRGRLQLGQIRHVSVFALAPQPLLVLLGTLLSDIPAAEVYQRHREPVPGWDWRADGPSADSSFLVHRPSTRATRIALALALSDELSAERIVPVLGTDVEVWHLTVAKPRHDLVRSRQQLVEFRNVTRDLLNEMTRRAREGEGVIHVFPAAPVSACVELGRVLQPKAHAVLRLYDQNAKAGGFVPALDVGAVPEALEQ